MNPGNHTRPMGAEDADLLVAENGSEELAASGEVPGPLWPNGTPVGLTEPHCNQADSAIAGANR